MGRANKALAARVSAIAGGFLAGQRAHAGKIVTTGNPVRPAVLEAAGTPIAAIGRRAVPPARLRRQPGRAVLLRGVGGARAAARKRARGSDRPAGAPEDEAWCARLSRTRRRGRGRALLHRSGRAHGGGASGDLALGRLDRLGNRGDRPAGDPRALSHALDHDQAANAAALARAGGAEVTRSGAFARAAGRADGSLMAAIPSGLRAWPRRRAPAAGGGELACRSRGGYCRRPDRRRIQAREPPHEDAADHRRRAFRRHRRHRHERHRRGAAQSRLPRCRAPTRPTAPTCSGCATRASGASSAMRPRISARPRSSSSRPRSSATIPNSSRRASGSCRSCGAPRCWPS
jgi:hypothetical protein